MKNPRGSHLDAFGVYLIYNKKINLFKMRMYNL